MQERHLIAYAAINIFIAIAAGAFGAHALKNVLSADMLGVWQTAVQYQMLHGLALLALANLLPRWDAKKIRLSALSMLLGIILFSGSLYLLATTGFRVLGVVTPFGGMAFLFGWGNLAWVALRRKAV